jgi:hypothetical protein
MTTTLGATRNPKLVEVPERPFLMVDGRGDPNGSEEFQRAIGALYTLSYGLRFLLRRTLGVDRKVGALEGLWWTEDATFALEDRSRWRWTLMIEQPEQVTPDLVEVIAREKGLEAPPRLERLAEGRVAEVLHVGPFAQEPPTIERLHAFIAEHGLRPTGRHHEIYLSDLRRTAPERLRTILRQPVAAR